MIVLGLGSNVGKRLEYLEMAIHYLSESVINITDISPIYESPALLKDGAPECWDIPFFNMAVRGETYLAPQELLRHIKMIERRVGRQDRGVWAPREIDIDILAYGGLNVDDSNLKIPHAALCERAFALLPFADIAPNWQYPAVGLYKSKTAYEIVQRAFPAEHATRKTQHRLNLQKFKLVA